MPPNIFTISAERPFLATLARGLVDRTDDDRLALTRITILLPTRRAVRSLREAFLRLTGEGADPGAPLLLPRMRAVGDLDDDELTVAASDDDALSVPPAIPELRRRLLLSQLILRWRRREGADRLMPGQAAALAGALARLLDAVATDGADFARLRELAPAELAEHWQSVLDFLDILRHWPGIVAQEGALDPAERRNRLLRRQVQLWRQSAPAHPIVAAGLVGGFPALDGLLGCVAWLEQGAVILPGLDRRATPGEWAEIAVDPAHPQHLMAVLLNRIEIAPEDVRDWPPGSRPAPTGRAARLNLAAEALRPAATTESWRALPPSDPRALAGLSRYDCSGPQDEAVTAALLLRRQLETPGATAALITPDRELARRVAAELTRWGIEIDDSAGVPLNRTPPGAFLRLVLDLAESELAPVPLLAALKHPLAAGGLSREAFRDRARRLEERIRGPRPAPGFAGLGAALVKAEPELLQFVERLRRCLGELPDLLAAKETSVAVLAAEQVAAAERLAATQEDDGAARLWREAAGEAAALFCHELIEAARDFPPIPGRDYPALFEALAAGAVVRPAFGHHPRLAIWGLVEARLQHADLVVLGGLNEGTWPGPAAFDPWMSRQMREDFGIAIPERAIGIAAHDFVQALGAPAAALTRAARREGVPTVPSRWLLRLDTVLRATEMENALGPDPEIAGAARARDLPAAHRPRKPARPCPPVPTRPRQLPVTQIEMWLRDPYAIYARHILRLKRLEDLDADPGRADLGTAIHDALAKIVARYPQGVPAGAEAELLEIGQACLADYLSRPGVWAFWWPRFQRIARWFLAEEAARRGEVAVSVSEQSGSLSIAAPAGLFTVTAKADRIDRLAADGRLVIVDYKTGLLPQKREIEHGLAVQLPLEGAIARAGGFPSIAGEPAALEYWRLAGGEPAGERKAIDNGDPAGLTDRALAEVTALIAAFDNATTPYPVVPVLQWRPRFSDYEHLERLGAFREDELEEGADP